MIAAVTLSATEILIFGCGFLAGWGAHKVIAPRALALFRYLGFRPK